MILIDAFEIPFMKFFPAVNTASNGSPRSYALPAVFKSIELLLPRDRLFNRMLPIPLAAILGLALSAGSATAAERVLAIGGAVTEIIYALGEEDRLIARDSTSTYPPEAMELPDVGYMRALSPEGVLSIEPDLILARGNAGPAEAIEVLQAASVEWVTVPDDFTMQGVDDNVRIVADALGVPDKGQVLRRKLAAELAEVTAATAGLEQRKKVLFILSLRDGRITAAGTDTAAHSIIGLAGAVNAIPEISGYKPISDEAVITADPDVILMMQRGASGAQHGADNSMITEHPALGSTTAARDSAILRMDGLYILGFGPRVGEAARELSAAIYPNASN
ncbi:MAG: ABC transporter substrate-binding protein [Pseudomonadota bacterium]